MLRLPSVASPIAASPVIATSYQHAWTAGGDTSSADALPARHTSTASGAKGNAFVVDGNAVAVTLPLGLADALGLPLAELLPDGVAVSASTTRRRRRSACCASLAVRLALGVSVGERSAVCDAVRDGLIVCEGVADHDLLGDGVVMAARAAATDVLPAPGSPVRRNVSPHASTSPVPEPQPVALAPEKEPLAYVMSFRESPS